MSADVRARIGLLLLLTLLVVLPGACVRVRVHGDPTAWVQAMTSTVRVATYNTSLYDESAGRLIQRLEGDDAHARKVAAVLQRVRPDVVLLNEFDYDDAHRAADLFQERYLGVSQLGGGDALAYPHRFLAPVNTGVPSGLDLDRNGRIGAQARDRGNDAWGYGLHPGQYGMLVLSRYPIDAAAVRTFQTLRWSTMPGAQRPRDPATGAWWYDDTAWPLMRLSSKSHWDVPVRTPGGVVHLLAAHPTPPTFDGPENRNGLRNADEIRLWREYISDPDGTARWLCDDAGRCGGLAGGAKFVIVGDYNADPDDGAGDRGAIRALLEHPRVSQAPAPRSDGASVRATRYGLARTGDTAAHTGDFGPTVGTLRIDYAVPSSNLGVKTSGVFWASPGTPDAAISEVSDHHLVWVDVSPR